MFDINFDTSEFFLVLWAMFNTVCIHSEKYIELPNVAFVSTSNTSSLFLLATVQIAV